MHDSGRKVITFEWLQPQTQNRNRSIPDRTAIHLSSNKWLNVKYFPYHMLVYKTIAICLSNLLCMFLRAFHSQLRLQHVGGAVIPPF